MKNVDIIASKGYNFAVENYFVKKVFNHLVAFVSRLRNFFGMLPRQKKLPDVTPNIQVEYHGGVYRVWEMHVDGLSYYYAHNHRGGMAEHVWVCSSYGRYDLRYLDGSMRFQELHWGGSTIHYVFTFFMLALKRKQLAKTMLASWREKTNGSYKLLEEYCKSGTLPE